MVVAAVMVARTGTVLINRPTIDSAPATSAGRPETAVPKATSCWPVSHISSCAQAPCSTVLTVVWRERASSPRARVVCSGTRSDATPRCPSPNRSRRADQGGGVKAGQHLAPGRVGGIEVPIGQPGDKPAIRHGRGQPLPVIAGEYLPQQDRQRPAIEHDVVIGQHKPVPVCCGADQRHPKGRLVGQIADRGAFGGAHPLDLLIDVDVVRRVEVDIPPSRHRIGRDDLHRLVELLGRIGPPGWDAG